MRRNGVVHLSEDDILRAVVDQADLTPELQTHLAECPACRAQKAEVIDNLASLRLMAGRFSPSPGRKPVIPAEAPHDNLVLSFLFYRPRSMIFVAATVVLLIAAFPIYHEWHRSSLDTFAREMREDEKFLTEVCKLEENALPAPYVEMMGDLSGGDDRSDSKGTVGDCENIS